MYRPFLLALDQVSFDTRLARTIEPGSEPFAMLKSIWAESRIEIVYEYGCGADLRREGKATKATAFGSRLRDCRRNVAMGGASGGRIERG